MAKHQKKILLVEEDPILAELTAFRLELLGHAVVLLHSAEEALGWLADNMPDLVIVGHFLPGMGGIDFLNQISNEIKTSQIPTMLLSPQSELEDVQKAFNAGADEYLVTPFDPQTLEHKVTHMSGV